MEVHAKKCVDRFYEMAKNNSAIVKSLRSLL